jgi:hypothetical protein
MYLKVGGRLRPFNEADASISYDVIFDGERNAAKIIQTWRIDGVVNQQESDASQSKMTAKLQTLESDFNQYRPDLIFLEDDGRTESALKIRRQQCLAGPDLTNFSYPKDGNKVYATGHPYTASFVCETAVNARNAILEFSEEVVGGGDGGWERVHVGGAINLPEEQIGTQHNFYRYRQSGSAVGLFDYPNIPPPLWPSKLKRPAPQITKTSARKPGPVDQEFRISWVYEFETVYPLTGRPHRFTF